jgi:hypothetical protein
MHRRFSWNSRQRHTGQSKVVKASQKGGKIISIVIVLEPRSIYVLSGAARWNFQHSIVGWPTIADGTFQVDQGSNAQAVRPRAFRQHCSTRNGSEC